jgi:aryl-alcohol dehydrogenase-like predicted oxidoreductase
MDYVRFGQTDLKVSQLCLGTMSMGSSKIRDMGRLIQYLDIRNASTDVRRETLATVSRLRSLRDPSASA